MKPVYGNLGRGFDILSGKMKDPVFKLEAYDVDEKKISQPSLNEKFSQFPHFQAYYREILERLGVISARTETEPTKKDSNKPAPKMTHKRTRSTSFAFSGTDEETEGVEYIKACPFYRADGDCDRALLRNLTDSKIVFRSSKDEVVITDDSDRCFPFLQHNDEYDGSQLYLSEFSIKTSHLQLKGIPRESMIKPLLEEEKRLQHYNDELKSHFFQFFERHGTHFICQVETGAKAEMWWNLREKSDLKHKDEFLKVAGKWKSSKFHFQGNKKVTQKGLISSLLSSFKDLSEAYQEEHLVRTTNMTGDVKDAQKESIQIGFKITPISYLFSGQAREAINDAMAVYFRELSPLTQSALTTGQKVCIFSPTFNTFIRVDDTGLLVADAPHPAKESCQLEVIREKNTKSFGLKSLTHGGQLLSKSLSKPIFHFHREQFLGPHESFLTKGDYLFVQHTGQACLLSVSLEEKTRFYVLHEGSSAKRFPLMILAATPRINAKFRVSEKIRDPSYSFADQELDFDNIVSFNPLKPAPTPKFLSDIPKPNSTSSIRTLKESVFMPNVEELTRCMAIYLKQLLKKEKNTDLNESFAAFDERENPLTHYLPNFHQIPSVENIHYFVSTIFRIQGLKPEPGVFTIIFLNRFLAKSKALFTRYTWRPMTIACIILSSKVWEDAAVWNADFLRLFPRISVNYLNRIETLLIDAIQFNVKITGHEYVEVYISLKSLSLNKKDFDNFMSHEELDALERKTEKHENGIKNDAPLKLNLTQSMDHEALKQHHNRAVLN